jgi:hypothetical protein
MFKRAAFASCALALLSCDAQTDAAHRHANRSVDLGPGEILDDGGVVVITDDAGGGDDDAAVVTDDAGPSAYGDLSPLTGDGGACSDPSQALMCPNAIATNAGCGGTELCGPTGQGNGLDDNCDGQVDEGCPCTAGNVESCFLGPPGKHGIGACTDGQQTCLQISETTGWGPCIGSIGPSPEICDKLDNDCNGCVDDGLCCSSALDCPAPGDARIAPVAPYTDIPLKGELFYTGGAQSWSWKITGGPCDQLFASSGASTSFTLTNGNTRDATVHFTLSGAYTVTLTIVGSDGKTYTCTWVQQVMGPGVRFELCWDHQGPSTSGGADLDLHVHRSGTTTDWFGASTSSANPDDCNYDTCTASTFTCMPFLFFTCPAKADWGYADTPLAECKNSPNGMAWTTGCHNPRLDVDNIRTVGQPENTNISDPNDGDSFRVMVHYYGQDGGTSTNHVVEHPIVNIYCGGVLKTSYGQTPNTLSGFDYGTGWGAGQMWRVADVKAHVSGGKVTDCDVTAIHPPAATTGYYVTVDNTSY